MSLVAQCLRGSGPVPRSKIRILLKARGNKSDELRAAHIAAVHASAGPSIPPGKQREERRAEWKTQRRQVIKVMGGAVLRGCKKTKRKLLAHFQLRAGIHSQLRVIASLYVLRIFLTCLVGYCTPGYPSAPTPPAVQPPRALDAAPLPQLPLRVPAQPASMAMDWEPEAEPEPEPEPEPAPTPPTLRPPSARLAARHPPPAAPTGPPMPLDSEDLVMLEQLQVFCLYFANSTFLTPYNQLQRRPGRPRQNLHYSIKPAFDDPSNQDLLAKLHQLGSTNLTARYVKLYAKAARARLGWSGEEAQLFTKLTCGYSLTTDSPELQAAHLDKAHVNDLIEEAAKQRRLLTLEEGDSLQDTVPLPCRMRHAVHVCRHLEQWQAGLHFIKVDSRVLHGVCKQLGLTRETDDEFTAKPARSQHWNRWFSTKQLANQGFEFERTVETDGIGVGIDPGVTQAVSAASGVWDPATGQLLADQLRRWKLTKGEVKHDSGLNNARRDTERWLAPIKPHLQHLAAASSAGTSLVANLKHITVTLATWDAVWEVYLDPKWAQQRLRLYGAQDRTLEQFFKKLEEDMAEVSMERHGRPKQLVVFFGAASIGTRGGWGADAVLRACCKVVCRPRGTDQRRGRVVLVDEHRTTRVSSAMNGQQPCERQLNKRRATRPAGWKPPAGQVEPRLLRPAWSQQRDQPVRGMMWCPVVAPRKPPQAPRSSQEASQPAASEPGPSSPLPAKRSKRTKAEQPAEPTQPTKGQEDARQATVHQWLSVAQHTRALADGQHRPRQQHSAPGELVADTNEDDEDKRLVRSNMHGGTTGLEHWSLGNFELSMLAVLAAALPVVYWRKTRIRHF
ncbi:hypothetical protein QJQ45_001325 [Haematococcus lacustris]|nr:hypothetical protein QJQ45_001325 [Haematococcus lacustris]